MASVAGIGGPDCHERCGALHIVTDSERCYGDICLRQRRREGKLRVLFIDELSAGREQTEKAYAPLGIQADVLPGLSDVTAVLKRGACAGLVYLAASPDAHVLSSLRDWRRQGGALPVLVISRPLETAWRVAILNAGADDWIPWPAEAEEVAARLRALRRRSLTLQSVVLRHREVSFDTGSREVSCGGRLVRLTARETAVLELLMSHHPRLLTRRYIEEQLSGWHRVVNSNVAEVYISILRRKLGRDFIETVHGQGYRLKAP